MPEKQNTGGRIKTTALGKDEEIRDEHRTSNVQHRMLNEKMKKQAYECLPCLRRQASRKTLDDGVGYSVARLLRSC